MMKIKKNPGKSKPSSLRAATILVGVTGSIAAYKACDLVRRLKDEGAEVFCLMSEGSRKFVSPLTFSALSGNPVACEIWDESLWKMAHLDLAEKASLVIIAPATANALAKLALGFSDDVISATVLSTKAPVLIAPAMHEAMWLHPATRENVRKLKSFGHHFVGPEKGPLARGDSGWGRLAEIPAIIAEAKKILS